MSGLVCGEWDENVFLLFLQILFWPGGWTLRVAKTFLIGILLTDDLN